MTAVLHTSKCTPDNKDGHGLCDQSTAGTAACLFQWYLSGDTSTYTVRTNLVEYKAGLVFFFSFLSPLSPLGSAKASINFLSFSYQKAIGA